ncbi:MAG: bifunctional UDP-N-acetylglucosamine diphosphorylase/glucosamine-1-phosphate N-acetyltransferase GlmU [Elusimicrobiota bacterium]|nr:bifunctional UDP-N-acetylglucosamine diphosphorylase/glucosamine-1-phosphate N-acetyltransferase GlmU [Endomicrobiia bacterium]MDW8165913.1 bifunctional UDP-N-acetylglucosamine diphosphorylase/glucosamine-1-phosphate N-acetyltransferase GlmU [Elusimicrobiota bacterium]
MKNSKIGCVILAAGKGTRMKSETPKVLFNICGQPMIGYLLETISKIKEISKVYIVVGYKAEEVKSKILEIVDSKLKDKIIFVYQEDQKGSGDALLKVKKHIDPSIAYLIVLSADVPLVSENTIKMLIMSHLKEKTDCSVLTTTLDNPVGYGRIVRDVSNRFVDIIEEVDANESQKKIKEVNTGIYIFTLPILWSALVKVKPNNKKKEYYLTDVVKFISSKSAISTLDSQEVKGINTRKDLLEVTELVRRKIIERFLLNGVNIYLPDTVYIDIHTKISEDTEIFSGCVICNSEIGRNCKIGPYSYLDNTKVADDTQILYSYIIDTQIGNNCKIGPFSRIINNTKIHNNVIIGNFVEITRSIINDYVKIRHHSYIGDTEIEEKVNVGAGSITCNYDGIKKNKTYIGKNTFVGSNVNLVAPIKVGKNVMIAAGSTVTKDIPDNAFVIARVKESIKPQHRIIKKLFNLNM